MATGTDLLRLAETRLGEKYVNVLVPKNNPHWRGPWDCAEFASWVVYQKMQRLYGCLNNQGNPALTEAYSGAWARDAANGTLLPVSQATANVMAGVVLIRKPPGPGRMGHVALTDGLGGTVEAAGVGLGVKRDKVEGRTWHFCVQIPDVSYHATSALVPPRPLPLVLELADPNQKGPRVKEVQRALRDAGFHPGLLDGAYGPLTVAAVYAFQKTHRLVADGMVGPRTAKKLGVAWP
ncbi:peptidoglycan-binding domain-containing protein, partial [Hymenobacter sp. IS2118]|uniref:peptidoglycan-binding domain-containing protein n=1 Tax=Hymenobacter sp. IS2118 TaxID=1505605 RepID=UPI000550E0D9